MGRARDRVRRKCRSVSAVASAGATPAPTSLARSPRARIYQEVARSRAAGSLVGGIVPLRRPTVLSPLNADERQPIARGASRRPRSLGGVRFPPHGVPSLLDRSAVPGVQAGPRDPRGGLGMVGRTAARGRPRFRITAGARPRRDTRPSTCSVRSWVTKDDEGVRNGTRTRTHRLLCGRSPPPRVSCSKDPLAVTCHWHLSFRKGSTKPVRYGVYVRTVAEEGLAGRVGPREGSIARSFAAPSTPGINPCAPQVPRVPDELFHTGLNE